jgi:Epoxide hydrolase N terminus
MFPIGPLTTPRLRGCSKHFGRKHDYQPARQSFRRNLHDDGRKTFHNRASSPIHFIHVCSKHEQVLPMIVTHGWPGFVIKQLKIIGSLTNPEAHGGHAADVFHIVVPSLPGYGFSGKPAAAGWVPERVARTWIRADEAGFGRKTAIGVRPSRNLWAHRRHARLLGIHTSVPGAVPTEIDKAAWRARLQEANDENLSEHLHHLLVRLDGHVEPGGSADCINSRSAT